MKSQAILVLSVIVILGTHGANATLIGYNFEGEVSHINDHGTGLLDSSVIVGTPLIGAYFFDSESSDTQGLPYLAVYQQYISEDSSFALSVGNYSLNVIDGYYDIQVENDGGSQNNDDKYSVESGVGTTIFTNGTDSFNLVGFSMDFRDFNSGNVFSSTELPTLLDLDLFSDGGVILITFNDGMGGSVDIKSDISSLTPVPAPSAFLLSLIGLLSIRLKRKSIKR